MKIFKLFLLVLITATAIIRFFFGAFYVMAASIDSNSLMEKINLERIKRNIPALFTSPKLVTAATNKTQDMFNRRYFDHQDPQGNFVWPMVSAAGYSPYKMLGENLAIDFTTEDGIVRAWINSPSHRDNMLKSDFLDQGLSSQYGSYQNRYTNITTSLFGTLLSVSAPPAPLQPKSAVEPELRKATEAPAKSSPAIQLTPAQDIKAPAPETVPTFSVTIPGQPQPAEITIYETTRLIFLILVALLISTVLIEALIFRKKAFFSDKKNLPVLLTVILVSLLTYNLY